MRIKINIPELQAKLLVMEAQASPVGVGTVAIQTQASGWKRWWWRRFSPDKAVEEMRKTVLAGRDKLFAASRVLFGEKWDPSIARNQGSSRGGWVGSIPYYTCDGVNWYASAGAARNSNAAPDNCIVLSFRQDTAQVSALVFQEGNLLLNPEQRVELDARQREFDWIFTGMEGILGESKPDRPNLWERSLN